MTAWLRLIAAFAATLLLTATPAGAADVVFPVGGRIGIAPPPGLTVSPNFPGYEDQEKNIVILMVPLPGAAYQEVEKAMTMEALTRQGFVGEKREAFPIENGKAVLFIGHQDVSGVRFRKWVLTASTSDLTALVTVQMRETAAKTYPEAVIRSALATLQVRPNPLAEQIDRLPFKFGELAGFRIIRVLGNSAALLTLGPKDDVDTTDQPQILVAFGPGAPATADRAEFARKAIVTGVKNMRTIVSEPVRVHGLPGFEIRAEAISGRTATEVNLVQWFRFGTNSVMRIVAVTPKESWAENFPKFRAIRDGMEPR